MVCVLAACLTAFVSRNVALDVDCGPHTLAPTRKSARREHNIVATR